MRYVLFLFTFTNEENKEEKDEVTCRSLPTGRCQQRQESNPEPLVEIIMLENTSFILI